MRYTIGYKGPVQKREELVEGFYIFDKNQSSMLLELSKIKENSKNKSQNRYIPVIDSPELAECYARELAKEINDFSPDNPKCKTFVLKLDTPSSLVKIKKDSKDMVLNTKNGLKISLREFEIRNNLE